MREYARLMRLSPVLMTLYCSRVMRFVVRSALKTPANFSLTDLHVIQKHQAHMGKCEWPTCW